MMVFQNEFCSLAVGQVEVAIGFLPVGGRANAAPEGKTEQLGGRVRQPTPRAAATTRAGSSDASSLDRRLISKEKDELSLAHGLSVAAASGLALSPLPLQSLQSRVLAVSRPFSTRVPLFQAKGYIIQDLYLNEIRNYKAPTIKEAVDLPTKFSAPVPPPKPEVEGASVVASAEEVSIEEEAWPALYNPIDDPANYNHDFDFTTDNDDGLWYPKRLTKPDYNHH
ncbi:hypothetical protein HK096_007215 [Nowakowskiella sp. JEL0078]|nr:hypothetical protein HK096_007215 [Nowakowskiella sp. JEL0078]